MAHSGRGLRRHPLLRTRRHTLHSHLARHAHALTHRGAVRLHRDTGAASGARAHRGALLVLRMRHPRAGYTTWRHLLETEKYERQNL